MSTQQDESSRSSSVANSSSQKKMSNNTNSSSKSGKNRRGSSEPVDRGQVVMEGRLLKAPPIGALEENTFKRWKTHKFTLTNYALSYRSAKHGDVDILMADVVDVKVLPAYKSKDYLFGLHLSTTPRVYFFEADSAVSRDAWVEKLKSVAPVCFQKENDIYGMVPGPQNKVKQKQEPIYFGYRVPAEFGLHEENVTEAVEVVIQPDEVIFFDSDKEAAREQIKMTAIKSYSQKKTFMRILVGGGRGWRYLRLPPGFNLEHTLEEAIKVLKIQGAQPSNGLFSGVPMKSSFPLVSIQPSNQAPPTQSNHLQQQPLPPQPQAPTTKYTHVDFDEISRQSPTIPPQFSTTLQQGKFFIRLFGIVTKIKSFLEGYADADDAEAGAVSVIEETQGYITALVPTQEVMVSLVDAFSKEFPDSQKEHGMFLGDTPPPPNSASVLVYHTIDHKQFESQAPSRSQLLPGEYSALDRSGVLQNEMSLYATPSNIGPPRRKVRQVYSMLEFGTARKGSNAQGRSTKKSRRKTSNDLLDLDSTNVRRPSPLPQDMHNAKWTLGSVEEEPSNDNGEKGNDSDDSNSDYDEEGNGDNDDGDDDGDDGWGDVDRNTSQDSSNIRSNTGMSSMSSTSSNSPTTRKSQYVRINFNATQALAQASDFTWGDKLVENLGNPAETVDDLGEEVDSLPASRHASRSNGSGNDGTVRSLAAVKDKDHDTSNLDADIETLLAMDI